MLVDFRVASEELNSRRFEYQSSSRSLSTHAANQAKGSRLPHKAKGSQRHKLRRERGALGRCRNLCESSSVIHDLFKFCQLRGGMLPSSVGY